MSYSTSLLTGAVIVLALIILKVDCKATLVVWIVRKYHSKLQPGARVFDPAKEPISNFDGADTPADRRYNCLARALDVNPDAWALYTAWAVLGIPYSKGKAPEEVFTSKKGFKRALLDASFKEATFASFQDAKKERRLVLAYLNTEHSFYHLYWLDGRGRWIDKPGEKEIREMPKASLRILKKQRRFKEIKTELVGAYWVNPSESSARTSIHDFVVNESRKRELEPPMF